MVGFDILLSALLNRTLEVLLKKLVIKPGRQMPQGGVKGQGGEKGGALAQCHLRVSDLTGA